MLNVRYHFYLTFAFVTVLWTLSFAQQTNPSGPADAAQAGAAPAPVLKVRTRLVIVDVVARDAKGAPVTDLKQDDFTVLEDGKQQKVRVFNFQHPEAHLAKQETTARPANIADNLPHFETGKALNVVLMDALNTNRTNQAFMRESMIKFLDKLPENEPIAVYLLGDRLRLLQDFTTDQQLLKKVVRSFQGRNSPLLNDMTGGAPLVPVLPGIAESLPPAMAGQIREFQNQLTNSMTDLRVRTTLAALKALGRTLSGYPGRKNLIWISETFPYAVVLTAAATRGGSSESNYSHDVALTGDLLSNAQVAIYPVDARGLASSSLFSAASNVDQYGNSLGSATLRGGMGAQQDREADDRMESRATMNELAERTGGRAFYNRNDVDAALLEGIEDGSTYYTLGYYPENKNWNGAFRKIQVKARAGVRLRYRIGYFATDAAAFAKLNPKKQDEEFDSALSLEVPVATTLPFRAMVTPPSLKTQNKVMVTFAVEPHALSFESGSDGLERVDMECAVRVFAKSKPDKAVLTEAQKMGGAMNADAYARVMKGFFPCRDEFTLQPGEYVLRLGIRDNQTGVIGTANASLSIAAESSAETNAGQKNP